MKIAVASRNRGKLAELRHLLEPLGFEIRSMAELGIDAEIPERGQTFEANARAKASALFDLLAGEAWALADDSGLEVDALGGSPGVLSARYAGSPSPDPRVRDRANNARLLEALAGVRDAERSARFVCSMVMLGPPGHGEPRRQISARGSCEGRIATRGRGEGGFGYDPLFIPEGFDRSMAELALDEKNRISHRGAALRALVREIERGVRA
ncbi:MAG: RdgB/HAM1 family non-canonical purine NTP pyrophosphatase [Deltaproteobacteria bacterium]|nr:RdgB/HAM1 family non-canonical purine NTP pyrophosphatase [Deltaproteobacteria bacterium]